MALQKPRQIETTPSEALITLADNLQLPVDSIVGQQLACFGMPGSGKTNAVALLCEQIGQFCIPMAIFDREGDFLSLVDILPRGVIATVENCPRGQDILDQGLQCVFDLSTWPSPASAAEMIATVVTQMMSWSSMRPSHERVPAILVVDEAHTWLPENRGATLPRETYAKLFDAFQAVGSTGRKRGLTPLFVSPKISELAKSVLYPGMYLFFKTSLHTDLQRTLEYVSSSTLTTKGLRQYISSLPRGKAIVKLPSGGQGTVLFHKRASEHTSHTPGVQAALNRYANMPFNPDGRYGMDMPASEQAQPAPVKQVAASTTPDYGYGSQLANHVCELLAQHPGATGAQIAALANCDASYVSRIKKRMKHIAGNYGKQTK